jgi:hypothetical protein
MFIGVHPWFIHLGCGAAALSGIVVSCRTESTYLEVALRSGSTTN